MTVREKFFISSAMVVVLVWAVVTVCQVIFMVPMTVIEMLILSASIAIAVAYNNRELIQFPRRNPRPQITDPRDDSWLWETAT